MSPTYLLLSILPFVVFFFLLFFRKTSLLKVSLITFLLMLFITVFVWKILPFYLAVSLTKGVLIAFDILIIILGAIFFLHILSSLKIIDNISYLLGTVSKDYRIQAILLAWFFACFIEGTAGFGTPSAVTAPLLVGLGYNPITAVILSLLGNSTSVAFGAAGTPIRVGFAGLVSSTIPLNTAVLNCVGFIVPTFMLWVITRNKEDKTKQFLEGLPFAVWSGVTFVLASLLVVFLGQEFPSILGSVISLGLILLTIKLKIFIPKTVRINTEMPKPVKSLPAWKALFPYGLLIALLVAGKFLLGSIQINIFKGFTYSYNLFNPGFAFIIAGILVVIFWREKIKFVFASLGTAFKKSLEPFLIVVAMSALTQLMINSKFNTSGLPSSLEFIAVNLKTVFLPFLAPVIGSFGSFLTGSATISNIMFGNLLNVASLGMKLNPNLILPLELVGASAGNMIALSDTVAAETVVGLKNKEREILKGVIVPCLIYVALVGIIGMLISLTFLK